MSKKMYQVGERKAIEEIVNIFHKKKGVIYDDDCAAVPMGGSYLLFCVDMINENIDYPSFTKAKDIGKVAVSNTLSDIAAMGGWPTNIAVCWGIPKDYEYKKIIMMNKGIEEICKKFNAHVITGDLNTAPELCISVTAIGTVSSKQILTQKGAKPGDLIAVIGNTGKCNAGVLYFKNKLRLKEHEAFRKDIIKTHAPLREGRFLAKSNCVSSCVDLTDGLYWGLWLLKKANENGIIVYEKKMPLSKRAIKIQKKLKLDKESVVVQKDGDFQLLFTIKKDKLAEFIKKANKRYKINVIGEVTNGKEILIEKENGVVRKMQPAGFEHFSDNSFVYKKLMR